MEARADAGGINKDDQGLDMPDEADCAQQTSEVYETAMIRQRLRNASAIPEFRHTCEDCGRVIPARRRKANPSAMRCIECQILFESGGD